MNGASELPKIWLRLWFSITIVITDPVQPDGATAGPAVSGAHATDVLPDVFAPQLAATASTPTMLAASCLIPSTG